MKKHKTIVMKMKQNKNKVNYNEMNNKTQPITMKCNTKTQNHCNENEAKQNYPQNTAQKNDNLATCKGSSKQLQKKL